MRKLLRPDEGWALVTALILMTVMAGFVVGTIAFVNTEQRQSSVGRQRETAFNLAEAALNAQIYELSQPGQWPGQGGSTNSTIRYPTSCTQTSTDGRCPRSATLLSLFSSADTASGASWTVNVRDNSGVTGAETFWNETMIAGAPTYDANGDGKLWVRSQARTRGRTRTMVSLVAVEQAQEDLPHTTLLAGRLTLSNNGNKVIVDAQGSGANTGPVLVRCTPSLLELTPCLGHQLNTGSFTSLSSLMSLLNVQISGAIPTTGYGGGDAMTDDQIDRLRIAAQANGTYYTSCPPDIAGPLIFIEQSGNCAYTANTVVNSEASPGVVIMNGGTLTLGGGEIFYGLLYHPNPQNATSDVITVTGNAEVHGGVIVDGSGGFIDGASKVNFTFDDRAFQAVRSYGSAGLIQNTWREIKG